MWGTRLCGWCWHLKQALTHPVLGPALLDEVRVVGLGKVVGGGFPGGLSGRF